MKVGRGAQSAISSFESTGKLLAFLLPNEDLGRAVLQEVAGHPVILAGPCEILHFLSEIASVRFGATFPGGTHQHNSKASIERHGHERSLSITRDAFDANVLRVHAFVRLQIVETARSAPCPRPQRAPVLRLPG